MTMIQGFKIECIKMTMPTLSAFPVRAGYSAKRRQSSRLIIAYSNLFEIWIFSKGTPSEDFCYLLYKHLTLVKNGTTKEPVAGDHYTFYPVSL